MIFLKKRGGGVSVFCKYPVMCKDDLRIIRGRCRCAYITVADPVVNMLPRAERCRQGVVGSVLVLLFIHPATQSYFMLDLAVVG